MVKVSKHSLGNIYNTSSSNSGQQRQLRQMHILITRSHTINGITSNILCRRNDGFDGQTVVVHHPATNPRPA